MKKFFSFLLSLVIVVSFVIPFASTVSADSIVNISADFKFYQSDARAVMDYINPWRTSPDVWAWNSAGQRENRTTTEFTYDYNLERIAMQRAAEAALGELTLGHTRPDNTSCFTCKFDGTSSSGECLAWGYGSAEAVFNGWKEENDSYSGQGHRRIMLNGSSVGIACCTLNNGWKVWALEIGYGNSGAPATDAVDGIKSMDIALSTDYVTSMDASVSQAGIAVVEGCTSSLPAITLTVETCFNVTSSSTNQIQWASTNTSVANVNGDKIVGVSAGSCDIVGSYGGREFRVPVNVYNATASYGRSISAERYNSTLTFVNRLYSIAMGRVADTNGLLSWTNSIINGSNTGASAARGFLCSPEYTSRGVSNEQFVDTLYKVFFDRDADAAGRSAWIEALNSQSRDSVMDGFIDSNEWATVCLRFGIMSGGNGTASFTVEPNDDVIAFATRLYTTCLNRRPDQNGLMAWARQLANLKDSGSNAAHGFFFSDEMLNNPVSDEEYVTRLYLTFMDRNPDEAGFNAWVGQLNSGAASREEVFNGFAASDEFGRICANYGIIR